MGDFDPSTATLADPTPAPANASLGSALPVGGVGYAAAPTSFDPTTAQLADDTPPAPPETAARVAGLGDRAIIQGIGHLADTPGALMALADRAGLSLHNYTRHLLGLPDDANAPPVEEAPHLGSDVMSAGADVLGLPKPATPGERVASSAVEALPSAALAPEAPVMGALSAGAGGAASQTVKEAGGSPLAQTLTGLAVGSVPAIASGLAQGGRALIRNQADTAERISNAAASGTPLTAGQATGSPVLQYAEGASSKLWGGGPIKATATAQTENLGNHVEDIVDNLSQGTVPSPTAAGAAINAGAAATKTNMRAAEKAAYDKVDQLVPPQSPVDVSGTLAKLEELATPTPGAEATTGELTPPKISKMRDNLKADIAANGGSPVLPYTATTDLRTQLGNSIDWGFAPSNPVENAALKQVHGALKGDIDAGASAISPEANQAVTDARTLYAQNQARRDSLNAVIDKTGGPEAVYQAATNGTKLGATKIGSVMTALDPGQQNLVRATVLSRLGRALPSAQNAEGSEFNASTFLTNWNKLDPVAKDALFGASGAPKTLRAGLDSLAETMSNIRSGTKLQNFSGTAEAAGHMGGLVAAMEGIREVLTSAHPFKMGAAVAGGLVANNVLARALVNPRTVRWLASSAKMPKSALPNAVTQLAKMGQATNDPDARDLSAVLQGSAK